MSDISRAARPETEVDLSSVSSSKSISISYTKYLAKRDTKVNMKGRAVINVASST